MNGAAQIPFPPRGRHGWPWTFPLAPMPRMMPEGMPWPRISIVTPVFNQVAFIEETIRSILGQGYPNLEYIIIDGGSTDGTQDVIRKYEEHLSYWVSEPDRGQSHAINKGLDRCTGTIFNWLNADDLFYPDALRVVAETWMRRPGHVIAGVEVDFDGDGNEHVIRSRNLTLLNFVHWLAAWTNQMQWGQPVTFLPLDVVQEIGGVREDMCYSMDHLLMIEVLQRCDVVYLSDRLAKFRLHDSSKTMTAGHARFRLERIEAIRRMHQLPVDLPAGALRRDQARTLVGCGRLDAAASRSAKAAAHLLRAMCLSPREACGAVMDFNWPRPLVNVLTQVHRVRRRVNRMLRGPAVGEGIVE